MRPSVGIAALLLAVAPAVLAQGGLPNLSSVTQPNGQGQPSASSAAAKSSAPQSSATQAASQAQSSNAPASSAAASPATGNTFPTVTQGGAVRLSNLPTLAGVGDPEQKVPNTAAAPYMNKSTLPDGTVFICVGAILAFFGAAIVAWRAIVAWSLHRSVQRAATAQNLADIKAMSAVPGKKRGMYNVVGATSTMSLDHLAGAPLGSSKGAKPFAQLPGGTPPRSQASLFFSPTSAGGPGARDSITTRSSNYLPAGYYASGTAAAAGGSPLTHVGGHSQNLSVNSLGMPGNRLSARSGASPPLSPSLPPSRGLERSSPSRDGLSIYNRNSIATLGTPGNTRSGVYSQVNENMSQVSLNVPGGTSTAGGRAPSAYLEDLFENHGSNNNGARERF